MVAGVVLAAGAGTRLRPLTRQRPKVLCPVGNVPLVDLAVERVQAVTPSVAVNVHHGRELVEHHLAGRVHLSVEEEPGLGTAGALSLLRPWIDGRPTLVVNGDAWTTAPLAVLLDGWDGERIRVLVVGGGGVSPSMRIAGALLPWADVRDIGPGPAGLWEVSWRDAAGAGRVEAVAVAAGTPFLDCGTPGAYLAANLAASGGGSVIGAGAVVEGEVEASGVWPGAVVRAGERLRPAIRAGDRLTVLVRSRSRRARRISTPSPSRASRADARPVMASSRSSTGPRTVGASAGPPDQSRSVASKRRPFVRDGGTKPRALPDVVKSSAVRRRAGDTVRSMPAARRSSMPWTMMSVRGALGPSPGGAKCRSALSRIVASSSDGDCLARASLMAAMALSMLPPALATATRGSTRLIVSGTVTWAVSS